jgi:uncharacterized protein (DUF1330 family)
LAAYVISDLEPRDEALLAEYRRLAQESIARHGGRYLARGGEVVHVEGGWTPRQIVIVEFPSMEAAKGWYGSPDYAKALAVRHRGALERRLIFVEGAPA